MHDALSLLHAGTVTGTVSVSPKSTTWRVEWRSSLFLVTQPRRQRSRIATPQMATPSSASAWIIVRATATPQTLHHLTAYECTDLRWPPWSADLFYFSVSCSGHDYEGSQYSFECGEIVSVNAFALNTGSYCGDGTHTC